VPAWGAFSPAEAVEYGLIDRVVTDTGANTQAD
jgi:ATP-dependent protease ClpP protease subunit